MNQLVMFLGTLHYEFRMQIRRPAVWITFLCIALLSLVRSGALWDELVRNVYGLPLVERIIFWTYSVNFICPIAVGVLLADRLPRDRKTKVDELLIQHATLLQGVESIVLLVTLALFVLFVLWSLLRWQKARQ